MPDGNGVRSITMRGACTNRPLSAILARGASYGCVLTIAGGLLAIFSVYLDAADLLPKEGLATAESLPLRLRNPPPDQWKFAVLGDPEENRAVFRSCLASARKLKCEFVVIAGDLVKHETEQSFELFLEDLRDHGFGDRFVAVRGNHDAGWLYRGFFGASDWSFEYGGARFIGLDNAVTRVEGERLVFAHTELARTRSGPAFVLTHRPVFPYTRSRESPDFETPLERYARKAPDDEHQLQPICVGAKVDYVLCAHLHGYERNVFDGVTQVISGTAGGTPQRGHTGWGHLLVEVDGGNASVSQVSVADPPDPILFRVQRAGISLLTDVRANPERLLLALLTLSAGAVVFRMAAKRLQR